MAPGTRHLVTAPLEFMTRLAALVPPSPAETEQSTEPTAAAEREIDTAKAQPATLSFETAFRAARLFDVVESRQYSLRDPSSWPALPRRRRQICPSMRQLLCGGKEHLEGTDS
jgi:hypothetical protein